MRFILSCLLPWLTEPYDYPSWCVILVFSVHVTGAAIFIFEWLSPRGLNRGTTTMRGNGEVNPAVWRWSTHSFLFFFLFITNIYVWLSILDSDKNVLCFFLWIAGGWLMERENIYLSILFLLVFLVWVYRMFSLVPQMSSFSIFLALTVYILVVCDLSIF